MTGGGCSGFSYALGFDKGFDEKADSKYEFHGITVVVDKKSLLYLNGSTLEWEQTLMRQGFKFVNPNEKASCGCGTSFQV